MSLKVFLFMSRKKKVVSSLFACISAVICILLASPVSAGRDKSLDNVRILIDTKALTLLVLQDDRQVLAFSDISIGRYGTTLDRRRGDGKTPLGHFTIAWITDDTPFYWFFGFNFPSKEYAERAYKAGHLGKKSWDKIRLALAEGRLPPQNTMLGGNLGIHGIGSGDVNIHRQYNWTNGCIALTNEQIDRLTIWIGIGTPVEIR